MNDTHGQPAIEVRNISKRFGTVVALDQVSFRVAPGELFFLLGPSGCGKTTMLRILAGLETADDGDILFSGRSANELPPHRRGAPMVFQNYALWPHLSVHQNVAFGLVERRVPKREIHQRVAEALQQVGLTGLDNRMPGQLSGGQQQRVVLARALVLNPHVLLLDEPLSNLDAKLRGDMRNEIESLHRQTDLSFVYVTHDQTEALSLADRLVVMDGGRIRAEGTPYNLYHRPPNLFCADFLGESNLFRGRVQGREGDRVVVETAFGLWRAVWTGATPPSPAAEVTCLVRPECLSPRAPNDSWNRLTAQTVAMPMTGTTVSVILNAGTLRIKAALLNVDIPPLTPGGTETWYADPAHTIALTEP